MKTNMFRSALVALTLVITINALAQQRPQLTVLNFDSQGTEFSPEQLGNLARMEVEKLDKFEVMDRYDVQYMIQKHDLNLENCYGKICLTEVGNAIGSEKVMSGTVEIYNETMIVTIRLIDVESKTIEKTQVKEFLNIPEQIRSIMEITVRKMFGLENNKVLVDQLTDTEQHENKVINPNVDRLNLSGPRFGGTLLVGDQADIMRDKKYQGGFDSSPLLYMLGYQFEVQYLNAGKLQALFEFIPTITGAEQGLFLPNVNIMHGLRHNINGWEFGMGLTLGLVKRADGFYDEEGNWVKLSDYNGPGEPQRVESRLDSRGDIELNSGFIVALGKSFKSGRMNIPVNLFMVPSQSGLRLGISMGFNAKK